jgi:hypothetical protein
MAVASMDRWSVRSWLCSSLIDLSKNMDIVMVALRSNAIERVGDVLLDPANFVRRMFTLFFPCDILLAHLSPPVSPSPYSHSPCSSLTTIRISCLNQKMSSYRAYNSSPLRLDLSSTTHHCSRASPLPLSGYLVASISACISRLARLSGDISTWTLRSGFD